MGRVKRKTESTIHKLKTVDVRNNDDDRADPSAAEFIYDEVDQYYADEERRGLEKVGKLIRKPKTTYRVRKHFTKINLCDENMLF